MESMLNIYLFPNYIPLIKRRWIVKKNYNRNVAPRGEGRLNGHDRVTYDLARQIDGATELKCSEFGRAVIERI